MKAMGTYTTAQERILCSYILIIFSFMLFLLMPLKGVIASPLNEKQAEECKSFFDEKKKGLDEAYKIINKMPQEKKVSDGPEEALLAAKIIIEKNMAIGNRAEECGRQDDRYFAQQKTICLGYLINDGMRKLFDNMNFSFPFCDAVLKRGDEMVVIEATRFCLQGRNGHRDYKKALSFIENFVKEYPEKDEMLLFTTPIYRYGGYGVTKNEEKSFEIIKSLANKFEKGNLQCELSLYYRDGIGTPKDKKEAEKWLASYRKNNPDKECNYSNFKYFFEIPNTQKISSQESGKN